MHEPASTFQEKVVGGKGEYRMPLCLDQHAMKTDGQRRTHAVLNPERETG